MGTRLVTIATFDLAPQARLAQNALQAAGIDAAVSDETVVAMEWLLAAAVGGIKLQVREEDADRAVAELERAFGDNGEGLGATAPPPVVDESAESEPAEGELAALAVSGTDPDPPEVPPTEREEYARRGFYAALFGIVMPVLLFYSTYLLFLAASGEGRLDPRGRRRLIAGAGITTFALLGWWGWTRYSPTDFLFVM